MQLETSIKADFRSFEESLIERNLLIDSNPLLSLRSQQSTFLSWSNHAKLAYLFEDFSTIAQFKMMLAKRDFHFCMRDGGIFQIYYEIKGDRIRKHRLCYVPCPFHYAAEEWRGVSLDEIPDMMCAEDFITRTRLGSPVRFDFDSEMTDKKHAHSHFSFNKQTCRIPAYGPISLGHFFRFIMRYFYEINFDSDSCWEEIKPKRFERTLDGFVPHEFHMDTTW